METLTQSIGITAEKSYKQETTSLVVLGITKMLIGSISHLSQFQLQWDPY